MSGPRLDVADRSFRDQSLPTGGTAADPGQGPVDARRAGRERGRIGELTDSGQQHRVGVDRPSSAASGATGRRRAADDLPHV